VTEARPTLPLAEPLHKLRSALPGSCAYCCLRFTGCRDPAAYRLTQEQLLDGPPPSSVSSNDPGSGTGNGSAGGDGVEGREGGTGGGGGPAESGDDGCATPSNPKASVCPLCLGCLQACAQPTTVASIAAKVQSAGYDAQSFLLTVSLPVQLMMRERAAWLYLQRVEGTPSLPTASIVDAKEAVRYILTPALASTLGMQTEGTRSPLQIHVGLHHWPTSAEHHDLVSALLPPGQGQPKRQKRAPAGQAQEIDSIKTMTRALGAYTADEYLRLSRLCPPPATSTWPKITLQLERAAITLTGRYRKLSRTLPQSPWVLDGARKCEGSVQECMTAEVLPLYGADEARFHSAGREDVDVRMLGSGRPFLLEILNPRTPIHAADNLAAMAARITASGLVEVESLHECDHALISQIMKEGEEAHRKDYRCIVSLSRAVTEDDIRTLNEASEVLLEQLTPMRVLHRRTLISRPRTVHSMRAVRISPRFLQLDLTTQAGTYVKEFVHGDLGRTRPSVGSLLGCEADILQLDVMGLQDGG